MKCPHCFNEVIPDCSCTVMRTVNIKPLQDAMTKYYKINDNQSLMGAMQLCFQNHTLVEAIKSVLKDIQ